MKVFEKTEINGITINNRIFRSATHEGFADPSGRPTDKFTDYYSRLAKGGVGAIITGYAGIQQNGKSPLLNMLMMDKDEYIPEYKKITDAVHKHDTPIIIQLAHCGRQTRKAVTGMETVAPSAIRDKLYNEAVPKSLKESEIKEIIENFISAIIRSKESGFDGVQLHCAHGYLLSQFISRHSNTRDDKWGGTIENRCRIVTEILSGAKKIVGDYPIMVKMNGYDFSKKGLRIEEAAKAAKILQDAGCCGIEVSCGIFEEMFSIARGDEIPMPAILGYSFRMKNFSPIIKKALNFLYPKFTKTIVPVEDYNVDAAEYIKNCVDIPVITVGGIKKKSNIEQIIENNKADYVSMCRPFIIEQNIVKKFKEGKQEESKCINCNYCGILCEDKPLKCYYGKLPAN